MLFFFRTPCRASIVRSFQRQKSLSISSSSCAPSAEKVKQLFRLLCWAVDGFGNIFNNSTQKHIIGIYVAVRARRAAISPLMNEVVEPRFFSNSTKHPFIFAICRRVCVWVGDYVIGWNYNHINCQTVMTSFSAIFSLTTMRFRHFPRRLVHCLPEVVDVLMDFHHSHFPSIDRKQNSIMSWNFGVSFY